MFLNFDLDSDEDKSLQMKKKVDLSSTIPTGTDKAPEILDATLSHLPPKSVASLKHDKYHLSNDPQ